MRPSATGQLTLIPRVEKKKLVQAFSEREQEGVLDLLSAEARAETGKGWGGEEEEEEESASEARRRQYQQLEDEAESGGGQTAGEVYLKYALSI
jgi:hypothetical protein